MSWLLFLSHNGSWPSAVATAVALLLVTYLVSSTLYSITLHQLAGFPGPVSCAVSRIPFWLACLTGKQVQWMHDLHVRYGPAVRYSPDDLSFVDDGGSVWKALHSRHEKGGREFPKAKEWFVTPSNAIYGINSAAAHEDHRRYRSLFAPAFSERALKSQEPLFRSHVDLLLSKLDEAAVADQPVDMAKIFQLTTFDIMGDLTFGQSLGQLEAKTYSQWVEAVFASIRAIPIAQLIQYYPLLQGLFNLIEPQAIKDMKYNHFKHSADRVDQRLERGSDKPDIWNLVLSAQGDQQLSLDEMYCHADVFMLAGSETTGTAMAGFTYFLLTNPDKLAVLTREIRARFPTDADITMESTAPLRYLNACIQESLRLYPPVPVGVPRTVPAPGQEVLGRWVGPETRVSVHHYATYRSAANFTEPATFAPERWLAEGKQQKGGGGEDSAAVYAGDRREAMQAFGFGPRNCLGQNMAMHEMRLVLARLLFRFDFEICDESRGWTDQRAFVLWEKKPLFCRLKVAV
ncbi:cytochrome P450 [Chaetomidium leptoderma]|uniref:Cytochrome P450 n=1 Tax=Chaetomidium leptoderma TaxID=669021 RepID=A0AAN6VQL8_9PEZI|nr:cytochrome P450 [Chaetomidium leptoderma]